MHRVNREDGKKNEMRRDKIRKGMRRDKIVLLASVFFYFAFFVCCFVYIALSLKTTYFSPEELEAYEQPVVFLESEDGEVYFISLDEPENKHTLDKEFVFYDYNPVDRTFLYSNGDGAIYEYDLKNDKSKCVIEKDSVCSYLNLPQDSRFGSAYYYFERGKISFVCGEYLIIYDVDNEEFIYNTPVIPEERVIRGWLTPQTLIASDRVGVISILEIEYFEYNVYTDEKTEIPGPLGWDFFLAWDKSVGCSIGYVEDGFSSYNPVLIWDTQNYEVKQLSQGIICGRAYLSNDSKYVMLERNWNIKTNEILCIRIEDESMCEVYTTEDRVFNIIW